MEFSEADKFEFISITKIVDNIFENSLLFLHMLSHRIINQGDTFLSSPEYKLIQNIRYHIDMYMNN